MSTFIAITVMNNTVDVLPGHSCSIRVQFLQMILVLILMMVSNWVWLRSKWHPSRKTQ